MPWCDECARYWTPTTMTEAGGCPTCGRVLAPIAGEQAELRTPWHFKLLLVAVALYLGYRALQGVAWVAEHV